MGASVGRELVAAGTRVLWCPTGRSDASAQRADQAGLEAVADLRSLLEQSSMVISLCPPAAAEATADTVREAGFSGVFVEANAISPERAARIGATMTAQGVQIVDGCVIGPPPGGSVATHLYLSGPEEKAAAVARLFTGTAVTVITIEGSVGKASALKMAYGSYQKATCALASVAQALGRAHGVDTYLTSEARRLAKSPLAMPERLPDVAAKAWRWAPEMLEAAATLRDASLPSALAEAAASVLALWEQDKDHSDLPLADVLDHLFTRQPITAVDENGTSASD
ncbi:NAD(P)-dependent oxidoreductase [Thermobifida halotolerans]|nr:NAD(P)-dependent oxidoreductase [Thermobifida halotolerans]